MSSFDAHRPIIENAIKESEDPTAKDFTISYISEFLDGQVYYVEYSSDG